MCGSRWARAVVAVIAACAQAARRLLVVPAPALLFSVSGFWNMALNTWLQILSVEAAFVALALIGVRSGSEKCHLFGASTGILNGSFVAVTGIIYLLLSLRGIYVSWPTSLAFWAVTFSWATSAAVGIYFWRSGDCENVAANLSLGIIAAVCNAVSTGAGLVDSWF